MIKVLAANWTAPSELKAPTVYQVGLHPPDFTPVLKARLDGALRETDKWLLADDHGPIVMTRISDMTRVWPLEKR